MEQKRKESEKHIYAPLMGFNESMLSQFEDNQTGSTDLKHLLPSRYPVSIIQPDPKFKPKTWVPEWLSALLPLRDKEDQWEPFERKNKGIEEPERRGYGAVEEVKVNETGKVKGEGETEKDVLWNAETILNGGPAKLPTVDDLYVEACRERHLEIIRSRPTYFVRQWRRFRGHMEWTWDSLIHNTKVWIFFTRCLLKTSRSRFFADGQMKAEEKQGIGNWIADQLLALGPTFIKVGQLLSTRTDILPREYLIPLSQLQDRVPDFEVDHVHDTIEEELGAPVWAIFDEFEDIPIAAASLAQVHRATRYGKMYAVKVQRPGLWRMFLRDTRNLELASICMDFIDAKRDGVARNWKGLSRESQKLLFEELDFIHERDCARRFRKQFERVPWIRVPKVHESLSGRKVLTMDFLPSEKITDIDKIEAIGLDRKKIARQMGSCFLQQLLRHGFFHADPHPGNVGVDTKGRLVFYDFGMMDGVNEYRKDAIVRALFAVFEADARKLCDALADLKILRPEADRVGVEKVARFFLQGYADTQKSYTEQLERLPPEQAKKMRMQFRRKVGEDLFTLNNDLPFTFPQTFTFLFRAFTALEANGKRLDPDYDLTAIARPFLDELIRERTEDNPVVAKVKSLLKKTRLRPEDAKTVARTSLNTAETADRLDRMEKADLKIKTRHYEGENSIKSLDGLVTSVSCVMASSLLMSISLWCQMAAQFLSARAVQLGSWRLSLSLGWFLAKGVMNLCGAASAVVLLLGFYFFLERWSWKSQQEAIASGRKRLAWEPE
uniref:ABC1 atypical kinase-like domain-containing protein n=1 Tax=Chromera velia CCMP2878 TaxID=1169474 RepID=A0A0G4IEX9_9ALVE|eukprot:Cvel_13736.t1-p1 / transcript=Cvel_13736.t1 / gene=Cvel_13736 / organism=Chromera_velia_CCMP2878 / gene_product=Uncharacterized protein sll1770, putative / transcript_product=Uncharacterized protein sll1770, putative / location=Cvel_scaffold950:34465-40893(-) / protein_length=778 / sequence_SO=supercontig / SO=protein_coding / is_pseudo=false